MGTSSTHHQHNVSRTETGSRLKRKVYKEDYEKMRDPIRFENERQARKEEVRNRVRISLPQVM